MDYIPAILILCGLIALAGIVYIVHIIRRHKRNSKVEQKRTASKFIRYPLYGRDGKYVRGGR